MQSRRSAFTFSDKFIGYRGLTGNRYAIPMLNDNPYSTRYAETFFLDKRRVSPESSFRYFIPNPSLSRTALHSFSSNPSLVRYLYSAIILKQVLAIGNLS